MASLGIRRMGRGLRRGEKKVSVCGRVLVENRIRYLAVWPLGGILQVLFSYTANSDTMYAVVEIAGTQVAVAPKQTLRVPLLEQKAGETVEFTNILLASDNGKVTVGAPFVKGSVKATVNGEVRGEKVLVFHKKRRKGYQKLNGHRQSYTSITITDIKI